MRITELLISIAISLVVISAAFGAYSTFIKNADAVEEETSNAEKVLEIDASLRKKVAAMRIPYWKNADRTSKQLIAEMISADTLYGAHVLNIEQLIDNDKKVRGLRIKWSYENCTYETEELFSSTSLFGVLK